MTMPPNMPVPEDGPPMPASPDDVAPPVPAEPPIGGGEMEPEAGGEPAEAMPDAEGASEDMPEGEPSLAGHHDAIAEVVVGLSHDFMIPMSEESLTEWVHHLAEEKATPEKAKEIFKPFAEKIAEGLYPALAKQIKQGIPTRLLLHPYTETAKGLLGGHVKPDYNDPKWHRALTGQTDAETGRPGPMSMDAWRKHLMTDPSFGFDKTPKAKEAMSHVLGVLHKGFGMEG